jgi:hypothetical protein
MGGSTCSGICYKVRSSNEKLWDSYITNLLGFVGLYKFRVKYNFYIFIQKLHEFHVMVNMNDICTYVIS